jgi:hypothetical protein
MDDSEKTIYRVMNMFAAEYPGKFVVDEDRHRLWSHLLSGCEEETILNAALHLVSIRKEWPPDIATMREQVYAFAHGELHRPSAEESWERIREKMLQYDQYIDADDKRLELTENEKKALNQTSTIYDLRHSTNIAADRATYIRAYNGIVDRERNDRLTVPQVKDYVKRQEERLLPPPVEEQPKQLVTKPEDVYGDEPESTGEILRGEELKKYLEDLKEKMGLKL